MVAGLTAWALMVPQAVAYGSIMGRAAQACQAAFPILTTVPSVLVARSNALFANDRRVRTTVLDLARAAAPPPHIVILSLEMSHSLDIECADTLAELLERNAFFLPDRPRHTYPTIEDAVRTATAAGVNHQ